METKKIFPLRMSEELHDYFKKESYETGESMNKLMITLLEKHKELKK